MEQFKGPTMRYDPKTGEGRVFTDVNDVPKGWVRSVPESAGEDVKNDGMSRKEITDTLKTGGVKYDAKASTDDLYDLLRASVLKALVEGKIKHDDDAKLPDLLALLA